MVIFSCILIIVILFIKFDSLKLKQTSLGFCFQNIEITMKFDNLRSELDGKERKLKDARLALFKVDVAMCITNSS